MLPVTLTHSYLIAIQIGPDCAASNSGWKIEEADALDHLLYLLRGGSIQLGHINGGNFLSQAREPADALHRNFHTFSFR
jgi:hypothetical protein